MRFATIALAVFGAAASASASVVARQTTQMSLPDCAVPCGSTANVTACLPAVESKCLCTDDAYKSSLTTCFQSKCTGDDLAKARKGLADICDVTNSITTSPSFVSANSTHATVPVTTASPPATTTTTPAPTGAPSTPTSAASSNGLNSMIGLAAAFMAALAL